MDIGPVVALNMKDKTDTVVDNIFKTNLGVKKYEKVMVLTDNYNREVRKISKQVADKGKNFSERLAYVEYTPTGCHGMEPPEEVWTEAYGRNALDTLKQKRLFNPLLDKTATEKQLKEVENIVKANKKKAVDVVIALSYYSTSHTKFRDILNKICGTRYASMPLFDKEMLTGAMMVNWKRMLERTHKIAKMVNRSDHIEIETPNGTFITFSKRGRKAKEDTGMITKPGQFSNLPAGEVFLAPLEGTAKGTLVLEWAPTRKLKKPVFLHIEKGLVTKVEGNEKYVDFLKKKLSERKENRNIAELGIGTNDRASRPDNILESEKIIGTIHIALGDNSTFGGTVKTSFHQDFVFFKPTVTLIYKSGLMRTLMKEGNILRAC